MSAQSMALDCDSSRLRRSAFSTACICTVKPRSLVACSAMAGMAVTGGPTWCSTTSLMVCAQIAGKPEMAPEPHVTPAIEAAPFSTLRRNTPVEPGSAVPDVMLPYPWLECGTDRRGHYRGLDCIATRCDQSPVIFSLTKAFEYIIRGICPQIVLYAQKSLAKSQITDDVPANVNS